MPLSSRFRTVEVANKALVPSGPYADLAALAADIPGGDGNVYITLDNGHFAYWDGLAWADGGPFVSASGNLVSYTDTNSNLGDSDNVQDALDSAGEQLSAIDTYHIKDGAKKYKFFTGAMRNVAGTWQMYQNAGHDYLDVSSISADTEKVTINTSLTGKIVGFQCNTSYVAVSGGITCGASVSATTVYIYLYQEPKVIDCYVSYTGAAWTIPFQYGGGEFAVTSYSSGDLILRHSDMGETIAQATPFRNTYDVVAVAGSGTQTTIRFIDRSTGLLATTAHADMRVYVQRNKKRALLNPANMPNAVWFTGIVELP